MSHTPGPWNVTGFTKNGTEVWIDYDGRDSLNKAPIAQVFTHGKGDGITTGDDNARLIACAPELLEQLIEEHKLAIRPEMHAPKYCVVCNLIAKAQGQEEV